MDRTSGGRLTAWALGVALGAAAIPSSEAAAQATGLTAEDRAKVFQRLEALEKEAAALRAILAPTRTEGPVKPAPTPVVAADPPLPAHKPYAICQMRNVRDLDGAWRQPEQLQECVLSAEELAEAEKRRSLTLFNQKQALFGFLGADTAALSERAKIQASQPLRDRPNPTPGLSTTLEFAGTSSKASVTLAKPLVRRKIYTDSVTGDYRGFRPLLLTLSGSLGVPVVKGESVIIGIEDRRDRGDVDILPGTTFKGAIDYLSFRRFERGESFARSARMLADARAKCLAIKTLSTDKDAAKAEFNARYGVVSDGFKWTYGEPADPGATPPDAHCAGADLIRYVLETQRDPSTRVEAKFTRPDLAAAYQSLFWEEAADAIPAWGMGASFEYGTTDFKFKQGTLALVPEALDPTRVELQLDRTVPLAASKTDDHDDWKLQAYGSWFWRTLDWPGRFYNPPTFYTQGVMFVGAVTYLSAYEYRPGVTDQVLCGVPAPGQVMVSCSTANVDRPSKRDGFTLSAEARVQFQNVPLTRVLGFAPKYAHRLEDDRKLFDLPIYLYPTGGFGSAGVRYRRQWDGRDLLGNPAKTTDDISIFVSSPLSFRKF